MPKAEAKDFRDANCQYETITIVKSKKKLSLLKILHGPKVGGGASSEKRMKVIHQREREKEEGREGDGGREVRTGHPVK